uniref:Uncharacterized protein n=1 Tax=Thermofilum adornatum TaxID=1365176 RepID=A0A7C1GCA4_9CREN
MSNFSGKKKYVRNYTPIRRVIDVVHERTGISAFLTPILQGIKYVKWPPINEEDVQQLDFDTFFARFPPFEPISVFESVYKGKERTVRLKGDYVWFVLPIKELKNKDNLKNSFKGFEEYLRKEYSNKVKCEEIICGIYKESGNKIILNEVIIPRTVYDGSELMYKKVVFKSTGLDPITIYYGLHKVAQHNKPRTRSNIPEILEKVLTSREAKRGYSPYALNYVTTCYAGYVVSTDPIAINQRCDACEESERQIHRCKEYPGRGKYEYRRRIFPKVYSEKIMEPSSLVLREVDKVYTLPYTLLLADNLGISKDVRGFVIYFDKVGKIELNLEKKISTGYFSTNSLMIAFDSKLVGIFINLLKENRANMLIKVKIGHKKEASLPLYNVLVSKYLWYKVFNRELNPSIEVDRQQNQPKISGFSGKNKLLNLNDIEKFIEELDEKSESENLERFAREVIAHTLAHVIYVSSIRRLPEVQNYVDYFYNTRGPYIVLGIFENTKGGMLRASKEITDEFAQEQDIAESSGDFKVLNPRILEKIIEGGILRPQENASAEPETKDVEEEMKRVAMLVTDKIASKSQQKGAEDLFDKVYRTIKEFYTLLLNIVDNIVRSKLYIDSQIFIYTILWRLVRDSEIMDKIVSYLEDRTGLDEEEIEVILEELFEAELYKILVEMLFPDMCVDGCGLDLYLPDCHRNFEQPFIISRSLLIAFLEFLGVSLKNVSDYNVHINRIDCPGSLLEELSLLGRKNVHILTSELSENAIKMIRRLLQREGLNIVVEVDKRLMESKPSLIEELKSLQEQHSGRLELKFTQEPHHGKMLDLDNLRIYTSWNFGTSVNPLQTYKAELKTKIQMRR